MKGRASVVYGGLLTAFIMVTSVLGITNLTMLTAGDSGRAVVLEDTDSDISNNDDYSTAQTFNSGDFLLGTTGLGDPHRIDMFVLKNVPAGKVINASLLITNFNTQPGQGQCILLEGWNKYHLDHLAWSNREDNPERRRWEAITFLCVVTGDYYISVKPIAGQGTINYQLNVQVFDPEDITSKIGSGGAFGTTIPGQVSSLKWYPGKWYKFTMSGEQSGMNDYLYVNMTEPGAPEQRLWGDIYVRNLEPESYSYWLNHSWWLDSFVQYEEVHAAATYEGPRTYYLDIQAYNTSGQRSENYELRLTKTLIESDGDNHPKIATPVTYESGKTVVRKYGNVTRGPDMFDWYRVYLNKGEGVSANLTLMEKSTAIFRLSIYRDNKTSPLPEPGYDLMSSWTNKPAEQILNRVNALTTNVDQEGWYYIGVIAQIGIMPTNMSNLCDWTAQTAWGRYMLDITLPDRTVAPNIVNEPPQINMAEGGTDTSLKLNFTGSNNGVFADADMAKDWGDALTFTSSGNPDFAISIKPTSEDIEATVSITPNEYFNGEANITFTATDLYGKYNSVIVHVRVTPVNDAPIIRARIPDFTVFEGGVNNTMKDIDLLNVFTDPDFPPRGDDRLTFTVDDSEFPATITDGKLTFGTAPSFPGKENHIVTVAITATDLGGLSARLVVNITVINLNRQPIFMEENKNTEIYEDMVSYFDLNRIFVDPDADPLTFVFLGGASDNLTVEIAPNGSAMLRPSHDYFTAQEILRFKAIDPLGANRTGELIVRINNMNDPPYLLPGGMVPDPLEEIVINEDQAQPFKVSAADVDNKTTELRYTWFIDDVEKTRLGTYQFSWKPGFDDSGAHVVKVRISDGLAYIDAEWNVTVNNVNQVPQILDLWPLNNTEVDYNTKITFRANATDADGDQLTFFWRLSDGTLLKTESGKTSSTFSKTLSGGKQHIVVLEVNDGKGGVNRQYIYIKVKSKPDDGGLPGFEALAALGALALVGVAAALMRRKQ
ncbi:MAG: hypothetical protein FJ149_08025 [Euryarchaeota archaeon]|nr:hypothetical protein [Euryarchaeota archaeon]